jgi:hypothetical protein
LVGYVFLGGNTVIWKMRTFKILKLLIPFNSDLINFSYFFQVVQSATRIAELEEEISKIRELNVMLEKSANKATEKEKRAKGNFVTKVRF